MYDDHFCTSRERKLIFKIERYFRGGHLILLLFMCVHMNMCMWLLKLLDTQLKLYSSYSYL